MDHQNPYAYMDADASLHELVENIISWCRASRQNSRGCFTDEEQINYASQMAKDNGITSPATLAYINKEVLKRLSQD